MTNHPNRNWRKQWTINSLAALLTHNSGFSVHVAENKNTTIRSIPVVPGDLKLIRDHGYQLVAMTKQADQLINDLWDDCQRCHFVGFFIDNGETCPACKLVQ